MNGCKNCPAYAKCTVTYRCSACAALRSTYGLDNYPEIPMTNADLIDAMSVEEKGRFLYHVMHNMRKAINVEEVIEWLQQPCGGADHE